MTTELRRRSGDTAATMSRVRARASAPSATETSSMTHLQRELEGNSDGVIDLTYGYPDGLQQRWMAGIAALSPQQLRTSNARQLKQEIATWFADHYQVPPEHVLLSNTACEALAVAIGATVECADDEILLFDGCFDPYPALIRSFKGRPVFAPRFADGRPDLDSLPLLITKRTRAVLITHPDNPLGYVYSQNELQRLAELCASAGLILMVDSAFALVSPYSVDVFGPLDAVRNSGKWVLIGDTGKIFDLFGVRCGALIASGSLALRLQTRLDQLFFRMDLLRLNVLSAVLRDPRWPKAAEHVNATVAANFEYLAKHLHPSLRIVRPMAGSLALLEFSRGKLSDVEVAVEFRKRAGVAMVPCSYFVFAGACGGSLQNRLRLALARPRETIERAVRQLNVSINRMQRKRSASSRS